MVRQGRKDRIVDTIIGALQKGKWCSNDPICSELPEHGLEKMNLTATARASIGVYNTKEDIDILCKAIENCRKIFDLK